MYFEDHTHESAVQSPELAAQLTTIGIDVHDPVDVLSWVPYLLGFRPHESIVLIGVHTGSEGSGTGLVVRFDLADLDDPHVQADVMQHLARDGADHVLCVIVTEEPWDETLRFGGRSGRALRWWLQSSVADARSTWLLATRAFRCVECGRTPCCPVGGRPASVLDHSAVTAAFVYQGRSYVSCREDLAAQVDVAAPGRRSASAAAARHLRRNGLGAQCWRPESSARWLELVDMVAGPVAEAAQPHGQCPEPALVGKVLAGLTDPWVRDGVLLWVVTGRMLEDEERTDALADVFSGVLRPSVPRVDVALQAMTLLASHATRRWRVAPLAAASWVAWWSGDGAQAAVLLERVRSLDLDHSLGEVMTSVLAAGIAPGWARTVTDASA
ncbi:DUF4192 domain-containing protein [Ruania alkalisoli]|uniref:DUF4192 domain-containing protein n=1 Tax=Ruania alkalisoli TaxID=2779775 RepID=A0A7M1SRC8_9MICO|nr:DUF4192 domain-containing protein [Ruania alkalisoli]QOR69143.1 DUF4192 domain-containing protein [Ruania alkalisoli]